MNPKLLLGLSVGCISLAYVLMLLGPNPHKFTVLVLGTIAGRIFGGK